MAVKIWDSKKFARINWQNRPSTATALGATNLNKIDVFCNDVDNALIQFDAQKLNIEIANSMLASVQYDQSKGQWTFKSLDGATYTFDQNIEKIPVSFSLSETGVLTMVTEDGTEYTANIADLIKDYVFDDSDTVAFSKEFVEEDDEGKGTYHISASVKDGSIGEKHLNPDYRSDILAYKTQAQEAANDALTYSKDSKRWAVGDSEYEGSETDNSKYYKEQAEAAKAAAEKARDEAQAATGNVIMTPERLGVGKPDNETIGVEEDGTIKLLAKAASLLITDTQGLIGAENQETTTQLLINAIADKVVNQLVTNEALTTKLENYILKNQIVNNLLATQPGNVLDAMQGKILADKFAQLNSELAQTLDSPYAFKGKIYLYRLGNIKKIYIDGFKDVPAGQTTVIDTIPKDYLPIMADYSWDKSNVSDQPYRVGLLRNGSLFIHVYTSNFSGENNTIFDEVYF